MFTVESNGDVRCALCNWTAPEGASTAMQNDLPTWKRLFHCLKQHSGQFASALEDPATQQHVERVLAMAAEPSTPPTATTNADDDRETPEPRQTARPRRPAAPPTPPRSVRNLPRRRRRRAAAHAVPPADRAPTTATFHPRRGSASARRRRRTRSGARRRAPSTRGRRRSRGDSSRWIKTFPRGRGGRDSPRAASPSLVLAAPSSAAFVPATRWPEAGEECQFLVVDDHTHQWYLGRVEATEARVVLNYTASRQNIRGRAWCTKSPRATTPAECIRLREDAPELPANIV